MTYFRALERSSTAFIHVARAFPARPAAASYRAFLSGLTRIWMWVVSPLSRGGRPLGRFVGSMPLIMSLQIFLDKPA
jgi:hypothetical protein